MGDSHPAFFGTSGETFGIPQIPEQLRHEYDFHRNLALPSQPSTPHFTFKHCTLATQRTIDTDWLAFRQGTAVAVMPVHTPDEFRLFTSLMTQEGGEFNKSKPNFGRMANYWSSEVHKYPQKELYYKLPEHLSNHYTRWIKKREERQTMQLSIDDRRPNSDHRADSTHTAVVLPARPRPQRQKPPAARQTTAIQVPAQLGGNIPARNLQEPTHENPQVHPPPPHVPQPAPPPDPIANPPGPVLNPPAHPQFMLWGYPLAAAYGFGQHAAPAGGPQGFIPPQNNVAAPGGIWYPPPMANMQQQAMAGGVGNGVGQKSKRRCGECRENGRSGENCWGSGGRAYCDFK